MSSRSRAVVRDAKAGDANDIVRLLMLMHDEPEVRCATAGEVELLAEIIAQPARRLLVGELDGMIAGTADVICVANLSRATAPWAIVENVVVDPAHRRRGLGRALMLETIAYAELSGCYKIQLISNNKRDAARALYRGLGFDAEVTGFRKYLKDVQY